MKRIRLPALAAGLTLGLATLLSASTKPNIVVILADDLGLGDVSYYIRTIQKKQPVVETPTIDALAAQGLWFTDGHAPAALCAPTRYAIMSGKNNYRSYAPPGVWSTFGQTAFNPGEATLGTVVRDAGYNTGMIGKWHLGGDFYRKGTKRVYRGEKDGDIVGEVDLNQWVGSGPKSCGFDYSFISPCGVQGPLYVLYENEKWHPWAKDSQIVFLNQKNAKSPEDLGSKGEGPGDSNWDAKHLSDILTTKAVSFIKDSVADKKPFFLYYCAPLVHAPHRPVAEFDGQKIKGTAPSSHLDMVVLFDLEMKRIVNALKETGQLENTLFVLTSDNGGLPDGKAQKAGYDPSGGWNGTKGSALEGGHRIPFFASWPAKIKPGFSRELVAGQDLVATLAALVGTKIPAGQAQDSNNLLPLFTGQGRFLPRSYWMHQAGSNHQLMLREGPWKVVIQSNPKRTNFEPIGLYNLETDAGEKQNLAKDPAQAERVKQMFDRYMDIMKSGRPTAPEL